MRGVYRQANIQVRLVSDAALALPNLVDLVVGKCESEPTAEQRQLYRNRGDARDNDIVVYFCRVLIPPKDGCSTHVPGKPALVISQHANEWVLAHEVGHLLGLKHVNDDDRLMTGNGTAMITNAPPNLIQEEIETMHASPLVVRSGPETEEVRAMLERPLAVAETAVPLPQETAEPLRTLAASDDVRIAARAVHIASLQNSPLAEQTVIAALKHPDATVRLIAAASIANLPSPARRRLRSAVLASGDQDALRGLAKSRTAPRRRMADA